jgi:hypothetical protein
MVAKRFQNPSGGLNEAGRKYFKRTEGSNLNHQLRLALIQDEFLLLRDLEE